MYYSEEKGILRIQLILALLSFLNACGNVQATATIPGPCDLSGTQFQSMDSQNVSHIEKFHIQ